MSEWPKEHAWKACVRKRTMGSNPIPTANFKLFKIKTNMKNKQYDVLHHVHKRKQEHKIIEPYPHKRPFLRFIDRIIYVVALVGPIMTLPQLYNIWIEKSAEGVSVITWAAYIVVTIFWLMYGVAHKEKPIIFVQIAWLITHTAVVIGTIIYG